MPEDIRYELSRTTKLRQNTYWVLPKQLLNLSDPIPDTGPLPQRIRPRRGDPEIAERQAL